VATRAPLAIPKAYVVRAHQAEIAALLNRQGIHYQTLDAPRKAAAVEFTAGPAVAEVQAPVRHIAGSPMTTGAPPTATDRVLDKSKERAVQFEAQTGDLWIDLDQPRGRFVALVFEPRSASSLFRTPAYKKFVEPGKPLAVVRVPR
jgi:hypothetical protein